MILDNIICHDVAKPFPLLDECVDVVITSPPYWGLRDYGEQVKSVFGGDPDCKHEWVEGSVYYSRPSHGTSSKTMKITPAARDALNKPKPESVFCNKCGAYRCQLGLEPHPQMYIDHLVMIFGEVKRVLKKSGSFYLNLGDTYFGNPAGNKEMIGDKGDSGYGFQLTEKRKDNCVRLPKRRVDGSNWLKPKQLLLIPSRVAIALQSEGWILRNDIIWHKPNPMPSSVKDRLNCTFEHVFHFVKSRRYYYNLDAIREAHKTSTISRYNYPLMDIRSNAKGMKVSTGFHCDKNVDINPLGKNPGDVIRNPRIVKHQNDRLYQGKGGFYCEKGKNPGDVITDFGKYGSKEKEQIHRQGFDRERIRQAGGSMGVCHPEGKNPGDFFEICTQPFRGYNEDLEHFAVFPPELLMKPLKSSCPKGGVVLDPFCGRGTTGKVAKSLGLHYILFDIKAEYCELAKLYIGGQKYKMIKDQSSLDIFGER